MRPDTLHVNGTVYWVIRTYNPDTLVLKDADSTPTVAVRKNGASVGDSVTITKRSATTGIYDCSYNPAGEVEGDSFTIEESATITGTTTAQATYSQSWAFTVIAIERGSDTAPDNASITAIKAKTDNLPSDPADASDIAGAFSTVNSTLATIAGYIDTEISALDTKLGTPAGASVSADIASAVSTIRGADNDTLKTLSDQIDGIATTTGTGARTVTITVNDGSSALQNATVRLTEGINAYTAITNVSGVCTFNVDDATYTVSISKSGYSYAGTTLVVDGTETRTYSMTAIVVTPGVAPLCTVVIHIQDQYGNDLSGEPVEITFIEFTDDAIDTPPVLSVPPVQESDGEGLVEVTLYRNAKYKAVYGTYPYSRRIDFTVPDAGSYEVQQ
jgi:hypothetical protein